MDNTNRFLSWLVFAGAVQYARDKFDHRVLSPEDKGFRDYTWDNIWALQRDLGSPPVGLIRSV